MHHYHRSHFWLKVHIGLMRSRKPVWEDGGVQFLSPPPHTLLPHTPGKTLPYVSGFLAELPAGRLPPVVLDCGETPGGDAQRQELPFAGF